MNDGPANTLFDAIDKEIGGKSDVTTVKEGDAPAVAPDGLGSVGEAAPSPPPPQLQKEADVPFYIEPKADLIYGATGTGKTENIGRISDWVLNRYGKLTRMVSADGGGLGGIRGRRDSGQIEFWPIGMWKDPIAAMYRAVRGWWPLRVNDPESPLVPPDAGTWEVYGFGAFEGLTSWGDKIIDTLKAKKASLSQDPSYTWSEGGVEFSGGNMTYFGFAQDNLQAFVGASHTLGYEKILWTAQESRGDDQAGAKVFGPAIAGKKAIGKAGGWFLNVWHMDIVPTGAQVKDTKTGQLIQEVKHVLFINTHVDPATMTPFPCKFRAPSEYLAEVKSPYIENGDAVIAYALLEVFYERQAKESAGNMSKIAGLKEKLLERAANARKIEAAAAEKRAKAANLLKAQVTVPAPAPFSPAPIKIPPTVPKALGVTAAPQSSNTPKPTGPATGGVAAGPKVTPPTTPGGVQPPSKAPLAPAVPSAPAVPVIKNVIQNVRLRHNKEK